MRKYAVCAVLDTVREYFRTTGTFGHLVQRTVAEHAVKIFGIVRFVAREIFAVSVAEKAGTVLHV